MLVARHGTVPGTIVRLALRSRRIQGVLTYAVTAIISQPSRELVQGVTLQSWVDPKSNR